jgi:hypothetical protein
MRRIFEEILKRTLFGCINFEARELLLAGDRPGRFLIELSILYRNISILADCPGISRQPIDRIVSK